LSTILTTAIPPAPCAASDLANRIGLTADVPEEGRIGRDTVQKALDHYRIDDPTAVSGVKQEGGDA